MDFEKETQKLIDSLFLEPGYWIEDDEKILTQALRSAYNSGIEYAAELACKFMVTNHGYDIRGSDVAETIRKLKKE